ncbi:hypothetical protein [Aquisphaera insulae]|uniref:hypothetical protein n=1 Tax=Aquisphaera insulae TaxID=2712864 RepID=UPI0013ECDCA3|nr:hypothetical protein [Aquisphaera insulae]
MTDANGPDQAPTTGSKAERRGGSGLRGLVRRIVLPWLLLSAPLVYLAYRFIEPTYWAQSLVMLEFGGANPFGPGGDAAEIAPGPPESLRTQLVSVLSDPVLDAAFIVDPGIAKFSLFKEARDPIGELRRRLDVGFVPNTQFLRIGLESASPEEAAQVVNAVASAYKITTQPDPSQVIPSGITILQRNTAKAEVEALEEFRRNEIEPKLKQKQNEILKLTERRHVGLHGPASSIGGDLKNAPESQLDGDLESLHRQANDELTKVQLQLIALESKLEARQEGKPRVQAEENKPVSPASDERERRRAAELQDLKEEIRAATLTRDKLKALLARSEVNPAESGADAVRADLLRQELADFQSAAQQIERRILQLKFAQDRTFIKIPRIDLAQVPKAPLRDRRPLFMTLAPVAVLAALLALSMTLRLVSPRGWKPDPDAGPA